MLDSQKFLRETRKRGSERNAERKVGSLRWDWEQYPTPDLVREPAFVDFEHTGLCRALHEALKHSRVVIISKKYTSTDLGSPRCLLHYASGSVL